MSPSASVAFVFFLCLGLCPIVVKLLRRFGVVDHPSTRSSHTSPVPRGAGIAPVLAVLAALTFTRVELGLARIGLIVLVTGFALIGLVEDVRGLSPAARLTVQLAVAAIGAPLLVHLGGPGGWLALPVVVLWIAGFSNVFNFMDGINGISAAQATVAGVAWSLVGQSRGLGSLTFLGATCAAASLAFLPFNFPVARAFLGDAGSYFFGALLSSVVVYGLVSGAPVEAMVAPLALSVADTGFALGKRARRGEKLTQPHRGHVYQQLVDRGWSHLKVTLLVIVVTAICACLGVLAPEAPLPARVAVDLGVVLVLAGYLASPRLLGERSIA